MTRALERECERLADQLRLVLDQVQEGCLRPCDGGPSRLHTEAALLDAMDTLTQLDAAGCDCHEGTP